MIVLEPLTPAKAMFFKAIRLRALQDTPTAFGSTYAKEAQLTDTDWLERAIQWSSGERSIIFLAMDGDDPCGISGACLDPDNVTQAQLISMWTDPSHRQRGIGRRLVDAVLVWARSHKVRTLKLLVTSNNEDAMLFYNRL